MSQTLVASETLVSARLVDLGGTVWANALIIITFSPTPGVPGPYMWGDEEISVRLEINADNRGYFLVALPDSTTITPSGSTWHFVISPNASMPAVTFQLQAAGDNMDISSVFTAHSYQIVNEPIKSLALPRAYGDDNIPTDSNPGQLYFDTSEGVIRVWNGSEWLELQSVTEEQEGVIVLPNGTNINTYPFPAFGCFYIASGAIGMPDNSSPNSVSIAILGNIMFYYTPYGPTQALFFRANINNIPGNPVHWSIWAQFTPYVNSDSIDMINPNNFTTPGVYSILGGYASNPPGTPNNNYSLLEVFVIRDPIQLGVGAIIQRAICPVDSQNPNRMYIRSFNTSTRVWTPWTFY